MSDVSLSSERSIAEDNAAIKDKASTARDAVTDLASEASDYVARRASDAKDAAAQWASQARAKAVDVSDQVVDYVERNPYKAIGIAMGAGFVLGLILKRR